VRDDEVIGALALEDEVRAESREAVAVDLGIAEVLPEDKDGKVAELHARWLARAPGRRHPD
jgi:cation transport ATPase